MKILLTNDDGLNAPGLRAAAASLREVARVVVSASDREQSGVGASVTLNGPVRAAKVRPVVAGVPTYAIEGTPADSVILALERLVKGVDLVVAGINSGANLGEDYFHIGYRGRCPAGVCARFACHCDIRSVSPSHRASRQRLRSCNDW